MCLNSGIMTTAKILIKKLFYRGNDKGENDREYYGNDRIHNFFQ